jgi:hypothetical protein
VTAIHGRASVLPGATISITISRSFTIPPRPGFVIEFVIDIEIEVQ